jgi:hypothetical protein
MISHEQENPHFLNGEKARVFILLAVRLEKKPQRPDGAMQALLRIIEREPKAARRALAA